MKTIVSNNLGWSHQADDDGTEREGDASTRGKSVDSDRDTFTRLEAIGVTEEEVVNAICSAVTCGPGCEREHDERTCVKATRAVMALVKRGP
jgi:hypothetical protein